MSRRLQRIGVVSVVSLIWLYLIFVPEPRLPVGSANGSYFNACCGTVILRDGELSIGSEQSVRYAVEQDKGGPYVLPVAYVGILDGKGFVVDAGKYPLKLRFYAAPRPSTIQLIDDSASRSYSFKRSSENVR